MITLDELNKLCKNIVDLLNEPHQGLLSWNQMLHENIIELYEKLHEVLKDTKYGKNK